MPDNELLKQTIVVQKHNNVDVLSLNRPNKLNALNATMVEELNHYFDRVTADSSCRVIIIKGEGRSFCAGADLTDAGETVSVKALLKIQQSFSNIILKMRKVPQPIIVLLHGACAGGGMAMALAADIRLCTANTRFIPSFVKIGLSGGEIGTSYFLPRLIGRSLACEILLTGREINAERALQLGLVTGVVDHSELQERGVALADEMRSCSPLGLMMTKEVLDLNADAPSLEAAIALENRTQVLCGQTEDLREGVNAFLEKRPPVYPGE